MSAFLEVAGASKAFGGIHAVEDMDFAMAEGEICGVIGPNGSGKTTLLGLLSGTYRPDRGTIRLKGRRIDRLSAHRTVQQGVARTFQTSRLLFRWPLAANLAAAAAARPIAQGGPTAEPGELLALVGLAGRGGAICSSLSNAEQRLAMVAVALATRPHLMLLDEPAVGMSPSEATALAGVIRRIRDERGATIIIVEHNMHFMMGLAERIMAMNAGRKLAEGTPAEIRRDPGVIAAYLGA
jgi:ABC-type branched-subunit amino acid transport system ATPase component